MNNMVTIMKNVLAKKQNKYVRAEFYVKYVFPWGQIHD